MLVKTFIVGMLATNCYVVCSEETKDTIIIDPGLDYPNEVQQIFDYIEQSKLIIKYIINTHGHEDHVQGNAIFQEKYNVPVCIHTLDANFLRDLNEGKYPANILLEEGSQIKIGLETLKVLHTPGHTPGSIVLVGEKIAFTGDTLFASSIGRTDFAEGSPSDMRKSLKKLILLPNYLLIYPGHGETSLMGQEKRVNPFLGANSDDLLF